MIPGTNALVRNSHGAAQQFSSEDPLGGLISPLEARLREYPTPELSLPEYQPVPPRSRASLLLEDFSATTQKVGTALAGVLGQVEEYKDSGSSEDSDSSLDTNSSDEEDNSPRKTASRSFTFPVNSHIAAAAGISLGVSEVARMGQRQIDYDRSQAIEHNERAEKEALTKAELLLAKTKSQRESIRRANEDELKLQSQGHGFLDSQIRHRKEFGIAQMQARNEAYIATLDAHLQTQRNVENGHLERERIAREQAVIIRRDQLSSEERLYGNAHQLTMDILERCERVIARSQEQDAHFRRDLVETNKAVLSFAERMCNLALNTRNSSSKTTTPQLEFEPEQELEEKRRFIPQFESNQCFEGLSVDHLLSEEDILNPHVKSKIESQFENALTLQIEKLAEQGIEIIRREVLKSLLVRRETKGKEEFEFFNFIISSLDRHIMLKELLERYAISFKYLKEGIKK